MPFSKPPMPVWLAELIHRWSIDPHTGIFLSPRGSSTSYMRIASAPAEVRSYFASIYGERCFVFTEQGIGIPQVMAEPIVLEADLRLKDVSPKRSEAEEERDLTDSARTQGSFSPPPVRAPATTTPTRRGMRPWTICDRDMLETRLASAKSGTPRLALLESLRTQAVRWLPITMSRHVDALRALRQDFPNFSEVIEQIEIDLLLARRLKSPVHFDPILLLGPPGVGKTEFMRRLSEALPMAYEFLSAGETTAGWLLTGADPQWRDSKQGLISRGITGTQDGRTLMIGVDELDKIHPDGMYRLDSVLLGLLEPATSRAFKDEYLDLRFDASPVCWVMTANRREVIRPELLSRLREFEIEPPDAAQMAAVVRSIDRSLRRGQPQLAQCFLPLGDELIETVGRGAPRDIAKQLKQAYGLAVKEAEDLRGPKAIKLELCLRHLLRAAPRSRARKIAMGFMPLNGT